MVSFVLILLQSLIVNLVISFSLMSLDSPYQGRWKIFNRSCEELPEITKNKIFRWGLRKKGEDFFNRLRDDVEELAPGDQHVQELILERTWLKTGLTRNSFLDLIWSLAFDDREVTVLHNGKDALVFGLDQETAEQYALKDYVAPLPPTNRCAFCNLKKEDFSHFHQMIKDVLYDQERPPLDKNFRKLAVSSLKSLRGCEENGEVYFYSLQKSPQWLRELLTILKKKDQAKKLPLTTLFFREDHSKPKVDALCITFDKEQWKEILSELTTKLNCN